MMPPPDPLTDRAEFKKRAAMLGDWMFQYQMRDILGALLDGDAAKIAEMKAAKDAFEGHLNTLLERYDNAKSIAEKEAVLGSVKRGFGKSKAPDVDIPAPVRRN